MRHALNRGIVALRSPAIESRRGSMPRLAAAIVISGLMASAWGCTATPPATGFSPSEQADLPTLAAGSIPRCEGVASVSAPADRYRDSPIYVANEQPTEELRAWAADKPGFEDLWLDRDHLGWVVLAFSVGAAARQAELEQQFSDVGVVAVGVDWTKAELDALQVRVVEEMGPLLSSMSVGTSIKQGVVTLGIGVLTPERLAIVKGRFAGERICVEGSDPADVPAAGPQAQAGDGWRLLLDRKVGQPYRTGIAWDQTSYERLWREIGLAVEPVSALPPVDFESDVAIWFGAVYGGGCPSLRLDDVVVDRDLALVYAQIVLTDPPAACDADANPHAYVVALERARLPTGPFAIQLGADDPPAGVPEERTIVETDLSRPGALAEPSRVHPDTSTPEPYILEPGSVLEPGFATPFRMSVRCGIEWLGHLNDVAWRTDVPDGAIDYVPPEWEDAVDVNQMIVLTLRLETDPEPVITASTSGHAVSYQPTTEVPPGCD